MKKNLILKIVAIALLIILVISIVLNISQEHIDETAALLKSTKIIKLYDYQTRELVKTLDEQKSEEIISKLNYKKWKESESLNGDEKKYLLKMYDNDDSEDIGSLVIYESMDYVSITVENKIEDKVYKINTDIKDIFK